MAFPIAYFTGACGIGMTHVQDNERFQPSQSKENFKKRESFREKRRIVAWVTACFDIVLSMSALVLGVLAFTSVIPMPASVSIISGSCLIA